MGRGALGDVVGTALAAGVALLIGGTDAEAAGAAASDASFGIPNATLVVSSAVAITRTAKVPERLEEEVFTTSF